LSQEDQAMTLGSMHRKYGEALDMWFFG